MICMDGGGNSNGNAYCVCMPAYHLQEILHIVYHVFEDHATIFFNNFYFIG